MPVTFDVSDDYEAVTDNLESIVYYPGHADASPSPAGVTIDSALFESIDRQHVAAASGLVFEVSTELFVAADDLDGVIPKYGDRIERDSTDTTWAVITAHLEPESDVWKLAIVEDPSAHV